MKGLTYQAKRFIALFVGLVWCLSMSACSAPAVIDPGKEKRERQEMERRQDKASDELNKALEKNEAEGDGATVRARQ